MTSDGRAEFDPSEIARVDFPTAFRGYDQDAVRRYLSRLAAAVGRAQELGLLGAVDPDLDDEFLIELEAEADKLRRRVSELEAQVQELDDGEGVGAGQASAITKPLDEAELIQMLGQETARVLETARSAAADLTQRAEADASETRRLAEADGADTRRRAEADASEARRQAEAEARARMDEADSILAAARSEAAGIVATAEADTAEALAASRDEIARLEREARDESARVRSEAREEAARVRSEASSQAESELASARERSAQLVADAEAAREEILGDLVRRRRISREQLVVMNAARDRLAVALASARNELDDVTSVLQRAAPAQEEIDVRDPAVGAEAIGAGSNGSGTGKGSVPELDRSQRAEVADLLALLDRNLPGSSSGAPAGPGSGTENGLVTTGAAPASGQGPKGSTSGDHGGYNGGSNGGGPKVSAVGSNANGSSSGGANGQAAVMRSSGSAGGAVAVATGATVTGGVAVDVLAGDVLTDDVAGDDVAGGVVAGDGLPMEYLTLELACPTGLEQESGPLRHDEVVLLTDAALAAAENGSPAGGQAAVVGDVDGYGGLGGGPGGANLARTATRGDLPRSTPYVGVLPAAFEGRDIALARATPGFRRRLKRAVNDDQSDVLERIRGGRGHISADELPPYDHHLDAYLGALRPVLFDVVTSGSELLGCLDIPVPSVESLCLQLARHVVDCLRTPTIAALAHGDPDDREAILDPIRDIYRDFRNVNLPELIEDALHEAFSLGLYHAIDPDDLVLWVTDPRLDPDPICEENSASKALVKGTNFPSGHPRPLSMPGCRCLLIPAN